MSCLVLDWGMEGPWTFCMIHVGGIWPRPQYCIPRRPSSCHLIPCTLPLLVLDISTTGSLLYIHSIHLSVLISHTRHTVGFCWIPAKGKGYGYSIRRCVQMYFRLQVVKSAISTVWVQDTSKVPNRSEMFMASCSPVFSETFYAQWGFPDHSIWNCPTLF